jgi:predicted TIM-barrel fold metal-dependent hydrolase
LKDLLIIDADGHLNEPEREIRRMMPECYQDYELPQVAGSSSWDRYLGGTVGKHNDDPHVQLKDMDVEGIDVQVIFPSGLSLSSWKNGGAATSHAKAYNDWMAEFCSVDPNRLKAVAQVALQDVKSAIREAHRAVEELGCVAVMMPTNVLDQDIGERQFWPFYEAIQGIDATLAVHGGINAAERMFGRFSHSFIAVHTVAFPFECMTAVTGLVYAGVPEMFPNLKIAILEGCVGWVPFLMDRMDEEFEIRGREAPLLKRKPSEYMAEFTYGFEIEESTLPLVIQRIGADKLVYASDYPHWDTSWPNSVKHFLSRTDISDQDKRKILGENPQRLYGFTAQVAAPA